jgi:hypothetical protein
MKIMSSPASANMVGNSVEYRVKSGSRAVLQLTIKDSSGSAKVLNDATTYNQGSWKVWKPDGTLVINGSLTFSDRPNGIVTYQLSATDTAIANAGIWEGEVEIKNSSNVMVEQTKSFAFVIEDSY